LVEPSGASLARPGVPPQDLPGRGRLEVRFSGRVALLRTPQPFTTVALLGPRGNLSLQSDATATAALDLAELPTASFPLRPEVGTLRCHRCDDAVLALPAHVAAAWAHARHRLRDYDDWLAYYPNAAEQAIVRGWREDRLATERATQVELAQQADARLAAGDFPGAWSAVQACHRLGDGKTMACAEAEFRILAGFVARQSDSVRAAVAVGQFDEAEQAAWLCRVGAGEQGGCGALNELIRRGRLERLAQQVQGALARQDFGLAEAQVASCLALAPTEPRCLELRQTVVAFRAAWRASEVERWLARGRQALRRRRWREASAAAEHCQAVAADEPRCTVLAQQASCRGRRCR
jgi:hypothetical protein